MANLGKKLLIGLFFLILVFEIVILIPDTLDRPKSNGFDDGPEASENIEQDMLGVHLVEASEGEKEWELWAEKATSYKDREEWNLTRIRVKFFGVKGAFYDVKGEKGKISMNTKDIEILGDVEIRSSNGYRFLTNKVMYDSQKRVIEAPKKVVMLGPRGGIKGSELHLTGNKMRTLVQESLMIVEGDIKANKLFEKGRKVKINCEEAKFSSRSSLVEFNQNVVVDVNTMRVTGPKAQFKYLEGSREVDYVAFSGGVRLSDATKWATAQSVKAYVTENKFIFTGSPRLVQGGDELRGEKIVFLDGGDIVKVLKANAQIEKEKLDQSEN